MKSKKKSSPGLFGSLIRFYLLIILSGFAVAAVILLFGAASLPFLMYIGLFVTKPAAAIVLTLILVAGVVLVIIHFKRKKNAELAMQVMDEFHGKENSRGDTMQNKKKWNWFRISRTMANIFMGSFTVLIIPTSWKVAAVFGSWMLFYNIAAWRASKERRMMIELLSNVTDNANSVEPPAVAKSTPVPYRTQQTAGTYKTPSVKATVSVTPVHSDAYVYSHIDLCIIRDQPKPDLSRVKVGDFLNLVQEPENRYDHRAIRVETTSGRKLGYMYRGKLQDMANDYIDRGDEITVTVDWVSSDALTFSMLFEREYE